MTRKDYVKAAAIVASHWQAARVATIAMHASQLPLTDTALAIQEAFIALFRGDNPAFDAHRFREACRKH